MQNIGVQHYRLASTNQYYHACVRDKRAEVYVRDCTYAVPLLWCKFHFLSSISLALWSNRCVSVISVSHDKFVLSVNSFPFISILYSECMIFKGKRKILLVCDSTIYCSTVCSQYHDPSNSQVSPKMEIGNAKIFQITTRV